MPSKQYWRAGSRRFKGKPRHRYEYGAKPPAAPVPTGPRACSRRREGDEYVCHCGARWDVQDGRPPCKFNGGY